ncbi:hypothetical protein GBF38_022575, partial [Nibea albiflora]
MSNQGSKNPLLQSITGLMSHAVIAEELFMMFLKTHNVTRSPPEPNPKAVKLCARNGPMCRTNTSKQMKIDKRLRERDRTRNQQSGTYPSWRSSPRRIPAPDLTTNTRTDTDLCRLDALGLLLKNAYEDATRVDASTAPRWVTSWRIVPFAAALPLVQHLCWYVPPPIDKRLRERDRTRNQQSGSYPSWRSSPRRIPAPDLTTNTRTDTDLCRLDALGLLLKNAYEDATRVDASTAPRWVTSWRIVPFAAALPLVQHLCWYVPPPV